MGTFWEACQPPKVWKEGFGAEGRKRRREREREAARQAQLEQSDANDASGGGDGLGERDERRPLLHRVALHLAPRQRPGLVLALALVLLLSLACPHARPVMLDGSAQLPRARQRLQLL